jgi:hypothetical protein
MAGIGTTAGVSSGLLLHATLSALGLSAVIMSSAEIFSAVKLLGVAYLIWLGVQLFVSSTTDPLGSRRDGRRSTRHPCQRRRAPGVPLQRSQSQNCSVLPGTPPAVRGLPGQRAGRFARPSWCPTSSRSPGSPS